MMTVNETTRRRHVQGRASGPFETSSTSRTGRPSTASAPHQHLLHHDHHHHHYHYHHHYHHFPRQFNGDQDQSSLILSDAAPIESLSQSGPRNADQQRPSVNNRPAFMNNVHGLSNSQGPAMEARDRWNERLRTAALLSHRHSNAGFTGNFLEDFSLLFEDDEDAWSDDELWELGIQEWLAALGFGEGWHSDVLASSEPGLSRAVISRLHREVFVPKGLRRDMEVGNTEMDSSEQDDCSVCLEHFLSGQQLIRLPCKHRFHPDCLTPWLESHAQCPYCRAKISFEGTGETSSSQSGTGSSISMNDEDLISWMEEVDSGFSQLSIRRL